MNPDKKIYISDGLSRPIAESFRDLGLSNELRQQSINHLTVWNWNTSLSQECIFARSILDCIAYTKLFFPKMYSSGVGEYLSSVIDKTISSFKGKVFYIPVEFGLKEGCSVRYSDTRSQFDIDRILISLLEKYNLDAITLSGSVKDRVEVLSKNL